MVANVIGMLARHVMPDPDGWLGSEDDPDAAAALLVEKLRWQEALVIAFARMEALANQGDVEGVALWNRVVEAIQKRCPRSSPD